MYKAVLLAAFIGACATSAVADDDDIHITVGDLSKPADAAMFIKSVDLAAKSICQPNASSAFGASERCKQAVRDYVLAQLNPAQVAQLDHTAPSRLAALQTPRDQLR
jgi:UrcA family protein